MRRTLDRDHLASVFATFAPEEVVHLAAATGFLTRDDPHGYRINVDGTRNVLTAAGGARCVVASSYTVALPRVAARAGKGRLLYEESRLAAEVGAREIDLPGG